MVSKLKKHFSDARRSCYIADSKFEFVYEEFENFKGYISILKIDKVKKEVYVPRENREDDCILNKNYVWLSIYPLEKNYTIIAMYDEELNIVEWYFDVVNSVGLEDNIPYMEDLYLDIVITKLGEIIILDKDELEDAFKSKEITEKQYNLAISIGKMIVEKYTDRNELKKLEKFTKKCLNKIMRGA